MGKMKHVEKAKSISKKIICLILIIMMLIDNLITPITIFAKELNSNISENYIGQSDNNLVESKLNIDNKEMLLSNSEVDSPFSNEYKSNIEYLKNEIDLQNNEDITGKTKNDDHEISTFKIEFVSGAKKDENQNLVWTPSNSSKGHEFTFRVNYAVSGLKELPSEALQIKIPKSIIRNRDGNLDDHYIMSLPTSEQYEGTTELAYKEDGDYIIAYNPDEVEAGLNGYFEVAYSINSQTFSYKDYDISNTDLVTNGGTASDPFNSTITVQSGEDTLTAVSEDINLFINTNAKILSTQKRYPNIYCEWDSSWMTETPLDSNEYYYLIWEISTNVSEPTQPYNFSINDIVTDLTKGTQKEDYELVGYKLSGEQYFSDKNIQENSTSSGIRYDYVLTRHKISTYSGRKYTLKNTETATVDPIDQVDEDTTATSSNQFSWDPSFKPPTGHFNLFKYGNNNWYGKFGYYWDYASYDLEKLQNEEVDELNGFKYFTETIGYAYPWTLEEGASSDEPKNYGKKPVKYDTWDDTLYLEDDTRPIDYKDYYLDYFTYEITNKDAVYDDFYNRLDESTATYEENETITFYAKFNVGKDWVQIGTYNLATKELVPNNEYVSKMTTSEITFKEGVHCTGWRFTTENKHYYTYITVTPYFVLTNSEYVKGKIANKDSIKIQNNVSTNIKDYKDKTVFEKETSAFDYARVTYYDSQITKNTISASNSETKRLYTISWKVNAWETATSGSGKAEYIRQDSGIFYDLIPLGGEVDLNSIQVQNENGFLPENEYTYETIPNYRNSGRTMLIVRIEEQAQYYTVYYNTIHSWESMADYGRNVLNPVAYETGNEKITKGYADNGGNLSTKNKDLYNDLDNTTNDKKFIYAEATNNINLVTAAVAGLYKKVKNSTESAYSYETQTEPNSTYSYQMRYQNTYINKSKNLILFDSLENFVITDSEAGTTKTSGWKGTLKSIDLTQIENMGIAPVLYISTKENLDLEENHDLTDTSTWTAVTDQTDLSTAKAIAIDMRKDKEGNDFVLDTGKGVTAVMYMQAPDNIIDESNPYTYNNIYINNTLIDDIGGTEDYFIHQDYTSVKYHVVADVEFVKVNEQNEEQKIKGITFRLYGTSNYGTEVDKLITSDKNGNVNFRKIEAGNYVLQEYEGTKDWLEDHTEHRVEIKNTREVFIDGNLTTKDNPVKIKNKPRIHTDVTFTKRNLVNNFIIEGVKFKLSGTSNYGNEILKYATSDKKGNVVLEDLEYGTYSLKEIETVEGYIFSDDEYKVVVDENGNYDILKVENNQTTSIYEKGSYNIYNEPYHSFRIVKRDSYTDITIKGAKFRLFGISDYGNTYNEEVESSSIGFVDFENLEAGTYVLQETFVPEVTENGKKITYVLDTNKYAVTVEKNGNVTIEGKEKNKNGNFVFYNDRNKGQITITKKWVDDSNNDERPEPTVIISTEKTLEAESAVFMDNYETWKGPLYYIDSDYKSKITGSFSRNVSLTEEQVIARGATRLDREYDNPDARYKIYGWIDENGNCYWWSNAEVAMITDSSNCLFYNMGYIKSIDTSGINTSRVTNMKYMFSRCGNLINLDISNFDTKNVTDMSYMFMDCNMLTELDLSSFDTSNVTDMSHMFDYNYKLTSIDLSSFDTSNVTNMQDMFDECRSITSIDVSNFNTSKLKNMSSMFRDCYELTELDLSSFDTRNVTSMTNFLGNTKKVEYLNLSGFVASGDFYTNASIKHINLSNSDLSKPSASTIRTNLYRTVSLDLSGAILPQNSANMFSGVSNLENINLTNADTSNVTNMYSMFSGCSNLTELNLSGLDTSNVTNMVSMFSGCSNLTELDLSSFNTSSVQYMVSMFTNCSNLKVIHVSDKFNVENCSGSDNMFKQCDSLIGGNGTAFDEEHIDKEYAHIDKPGEPGYFTYKEYTKKNIENAENSGDTSNTGNTAGTGNTTDSGSTENTDEDLESSLTYSSADEHFDESGNKVEWVKNGDTWEYTFYVDDPYADWYVWEEPVPEGYEVNYSKFTPGNIENQKATITNFSPEMENLVSYGNLKFTKKLYTLENGAWREMTAEEDNTQFTFMVALTPPSGQEDKISGTKIFGDYIFKDGIAMIKLHANESALITDLPAGTQFSIQEKEMNGYITQYAYGSGTITKDETIDGIMYNYKITPEFNPGGTPIEPEKTVNITLAKKVTGNSEKDDSYTLEVALDNLKPETKYYLSNNECFISDRNGSANITITLKNNESVTVKDIPVGSKYKVYEKAGNYISSYVITDSNNVGAINNSASSNTKNNTALSTATETADEGENVTITFTNNKKVTQNLKLAKVVTDKNDKNTYIFNIEFGNMEENSSFNSSVGKVTAESNGKAEITIYLAGGEEAEFYSVPVGTTYRVTELASTAIASYAITDSNGTNKIAKESDANTKSKKALSTDIETVNEGEEATVTFTNDTVNQEPDSVSTSIGVTKEVLKMDGTKFEDCEDTFTFELKADNKDNPMPADTSVTITGNGDASFGKITFEKTGTYSYKITEKKGTLEYYDYDETVYSVVYEVTNTEGLLEITKSVKKNGFNSDVIAFINKVSKADVKVSKLDEDKNSLKDATLQILDSEKNVVDEWVTDGQEHVKKLAPGEYIFHEEKAPNGYYKTEDIKFTVTEDGKILVDSQEVEKIIVTDNLVKGQIALTKIGEVLNEETIQDKTLGYTTYIMDYIRGTLNNATFELYAREDIVTASGKVVYTANEKIAEQSTDADGIVIFDDLYLGNYYVVETNAPEGFEPIEKEIDLVLSYKNDEEKVVFADKEVKNDRMKLDLSVTKNEKGNVDKKLKGAIYGVYNVKEIKNIKPDTLLSVAQTDENGYAKFDIDLPIGNYYVKEIKAPKGYKLSTEVQEVEFKETKEVNLVFEDDYTKVTIKKMDAETEKDVIGAILQVLDKDRNVVEAYNNEGAQAVKLEWTTEQAIDENGNPVIDENGNPVAKEVTFTKLPIGTYILHEEKSPEGYEISKDIIFTVKEDGKVEVDGKEVNEVIMLDSKIKEKTNTPNDSNNEVDDNKSDNSNNKVEDNNFDNNNNKVEDNTTAKFSIPKTGQTRLLHITVVGIILICIVSLLGIRKDEENKKQKSKK